MTIRRLLAAGAVGLLTTLGLAGQAFAYTVAPQYAVTDFATGFSSVGPIGLAFDASNHLFVMEYPQGILFKFGTSGGAANATTQVNTVGIPGSPAGIAFSKDGRLYAARQGSNDLIEISPTTGALLRVVASDMTFATGIATDPLSGDLFVTSPTTNVIWRISAFSGVGATKTTYSEIFDPDGITFGPDGSIYVASGGHAKKISGTNVSGAHTVTDIAAVPTIDGIAVAVSADTTRPPAIFGNRNDGKITKVDLTKNPVELTDIVSGGTRGDFSAVGPDGCLYATQSTTVAKVTNADGTCSFAPTTAVPILRLTPATQTAPVQTAVTLTATLTNVTTGSGHVVTFTVTGANPKVGTATTDSSGKATFTYTGTTTGIDTVVATTSSGEQVVTSNTAKVTWTAALPTPAPPVLPSTGGGTSTPLELALMLGVALAALGGVLLLRRRT
jgi:LPXTG-motif cell wall-anchored protein